MKTNKYILTLALAFWSAMGNLYAVDKSYYSSIDDKSGTALREALTNLVYTKHTTDVGYNWDFAGIDIVNGEVLDMYSTCTWTSSNQGKNYNGICDAYNREHVVPQNVFEEKYPQKSDRHHLFLVDGKVNGMRSSYPFGETNATNGFSGVTNSGKALGKIGTSSSGFSGTVYEPDDEYKGDIARAIMYMAIRYATASVCKTNGGSANAYPVTTWSNAMFSGSLSTNYGLSNNAVAMYMKWHKADPPSTKEIARNNGVEAVQGNRNPFVDLPDLADYLWGDKKTTAVSLTSLTLATGGGSVPTTYNITLNRHGVTETVTCTGTYTLPNASTEEDACDGWEFKGWVTAPIAEEGVTTAPTYTTSVSSATTLYAVYGNTTTSAPRRAKMAEEVVYTLTPTSGTNNSYAGNCDIEIDDITWNLMGNSQTNPWRIGGKSLSNVNRSLSSKTAIANNVTKIEIEHGAASSITINSMTVVVSQNSNFSNPVSTLTPTFAVNNTVTVTRPDGKDWSNCYYKITYNVSVSGTSNKFLEFKGATFYAEEGGSSGGGTTTYKTSPTCGTLRTISLASNGDVTGGDFWASATSAYPGATITLNAAPDDGYTFGSWTVTKAGGGSVTVNDNQFEMPDDNVTVSASFNPKTKYTINFYNNGSVIRTQSVPEGSNPNIPEIEDCDDYTFVGWWTSALAADNTTAQTWITDFTVTGAQDYYAVFAHTEGGGGSSNGSQTFTFSSIASANSWENGVAYTTVEIAPVTIEAEGGGNNGKWYTSSNGSWRMYSGGTVNISVESGSVTSVTSSPNCTFTILNGNASFSPSARTDFTSITVNYTASGSGTTYYTSTTSCASACTKLDAPSVTATPGNGQIALSWSAIDGATGYTVSISKGAGYTTECGSAVTSPVTVTGTSHTFNGLINGLTYTTNVVANATSASCDSEADQNEATPMNCTAWDDPTIEWNKYSLNTSNNTTATLTSVTGETHGTRSFESNNPDVLSVASNGTVTALNPGSATVTAHWTAADGYCEKIVISSTFAITGQLTITYNANYGETPATTTQAVIYNTAATLTANGFTRTGYTFIGWATAPDGEKVYNNSQANVTFTNSVTLYAVWQVKSNNVTFDPSPTGATVTINGQSTNPQSAEYGSTVTIAITPADHYTISSVTATAATSGSSLTLTGTGDTRTFTMPDENVTVAVSLVAETQCTATFMNNTVKFAEVTGFVDDDIAAPATAPESCDDDEFTFVGWVTSEQTTESTSHPEILNFPQTMPTGGVTYYALFRRSEGGTGGNAGVTFKTASEDGTSPYTSDSDIKANLVDTYTGIASFAGNKLYKGANGVKLGSSKGNGYITVELSPAITTDKITVVASKYGTDGGKLQVEVNGDTEFGEALSPADGTLDFTGTATEISSLTVSTTSNRAYIASISLGGGGTSYYTTAPVCAPCENKVTLTKGTESHGTFTLSQANGSYDNCKKNFSLTVSAITPETGYYCTGVTATGNSTIVSVTGPDGSGNYTVAYAKGYSVNSTVTANFAPIPTYTVIWSIDGDESDTEQYAEGADIDFSHATPSCSGKTFMGWSAVEIDDPIDDEPDYVTSATMGTSTLTYYAVFATPSGSAPVRRMKAENPSKTFTFSDIASANSWENGVAYTTVQDAPVTITADGGGNNGKWYTSGSGSWRMYSGGTVNISVASGSVTSVTSSPNCTFTISNGNASFSPSARTDFTSITVEYTLDGGGSGDTGGDTGGGSGGGGGSSAYTDYTTTCTPPAKVTVTFNANGGEGTMANQLIDYNTATPLNANTFTRTGYAFDGWATSADGEKVYNDLESVTLTRRTTNLFARWKKNSYNINITALTNGTISTSPANKAEFEESVMVIVSPDANHQLATVTVTNDKTHEELSLSGSGNTRTFTMPASSVTVTVTLSLIPTYTVTWSADGIIETEQYREGQDIVFPATADGCEGKTFVGWCASPVVPETDTKPTLVSAATMGTSALTYYAVYAVATAGAAGKYTLDYDAENLTSTSGWGSYGTALNYTASDGGAWVIKAYKNTGMQINTGKDCSIKIPSCSGNITSIEVTCSAAKAVGFSIANYSGSGTITYEVTGSDATSQTLDFTGKELKDGYIVPKSGSTAITKIVVNYGTNTYKGYTTSCGASINAKNNTWVTAANGQTVKAIIPVVAKAFDEAVTLSAVSDNAHFVASLAETAVPGTAAGLTTTLTVAYTPVAANTTESATITLSAGDKTKEITVNGRSLPEQFLIITRKASTWYALPANMSSGAGQYEGEVVTPDDATTPTSVAASPSSIVYSLKAVASGRYATAGNCVRLVGNNDLCLWANNTAGAVGIKNSEKLADSNGSNNEWLLTTTDGVNYKIANPAHPDYASGRVLAYGQKFGLYVQETEFCFVSTGCNTQPQNVHVSPRRDDASFLWTSSAAVMHIYVYSDETMSSLVTSADATASPYFLEGLSEKTNYWYKLTPDDDAACSMTGSFSTSGPTIDVIEWGNDTVTILVDKDPDLDPTLTITGVIEHGLGDEAVVATELFFSKYFEGAGNMKLVAIYNGTPDAINLANYQLYTQNAGAPVWNDGDIPAYSFGETTTNYPISALGTILAGQEIVFFTRPSEDNNPNSLHACSDAYLTEMAGKSSAEEPVRWIECDNSTYYGGSKFPTMQFNGNDAICLKKNGNLIDVIGATGAPGRVKNCQGPNQSNKANDLGWAVTVKNIDYQKSVTDASFTGLYEASSKASDTDEKKLAILAGFNIDLTNEYIDLTTARCILFRDKKVTSGEKAVALNTGGNFVTAGNHTYQGENYTSEWNGRLVCMDAAHKNAAGVENDSWATCNSYNDLGVFDFNNYYTETTNLGDNSSLSDYLIEGTDIGNEGLYEIPITDLARFSCLNLEFKLEDGGDVLTEKEVKVPIVIKDEKTTVDPIFNEIVKKDNGDPLYTQSINRCKECEVLVLGTGSLTKVADGTTHDVAQVDKITIYPGGKLIVPAGANYTTNDLTYRVDGESVPVSELNGNLMTNNEKLYVTRRITNDRYYFFSLPYDCNLSDVTLSSGKNVVNGIDYRLLEYDSDARAQEGSLAGTPGHWKLAEGVIKAGTGYVIAVPTSNPRELVFPMALEDRNLTNLERTKQTNRVPIEEYVSSQTRENNHNWNLIAHPYLTIFDVSNPGVTIEDAWENPTRPDSTWVKIFDPDYRPDSTGTILAQGTVADGAAWTLLIDGAMTIEGEGEIPSYSATASMPWYEYKDKIVNLTIKGNVTKIGDYAFYLCSALNSVTIIAPVTYIGDNAFYGCTGLANFTIATDQCISVTSTTFTNVELSNINLIVPQSQVNCYSNTTNGIWSKMNITITADGTTSGAPQRMQPRRMRMDEGDWEPSPGGIYITVPQVEGKTITYEQRWIKDLDNIPPFVSVFVQGDGKGEMTFNLYPEAPAPARRLMARKSKTTEDGTIFVGVTLSGNGEKDLASLRLRPDFPDKYKLGLDLLKFTTFYTPRPQIYMKTPDYKLAFRAINDDYAAKYWMPMGVYCRDAGTYTFSLYDRYPLDEVEGVYLFDIETGAVTNLLLGNYTIETTKQLYTEKRFYVNVRLRREVVVDTPTYIEPVDDPNAPHKFIRDGLMYIMRDGKVYDLTGKPAELDKLLLNR